MREMTGDQTAGALFDEVASLRAEAARSERHRNDLHDEIISLRTERGALRASEAALQERIDGLLGVMRNARHAAMGGTAQKTTVELLHLLASQWGDRAGIVGSPTEDDIMTYACLLESADSMMRGALAKTEAA